MIDKVIAFIMSIVTALGGVAGFQQADSANNLSQLSTSSTDFFRPPTMPSSPDLMNSIYPDELEKAINDQRVAAGLPARVPDATLDDAAARHAREMAIKGNTFHSDQFAANEILYSRQQPGYMAHVNIQDWNNDPAAKAKILDAKYTKFEAGVAQTLDNKIVVVVRFS